MSSGVAGVAGVAGVEGNLVFFKSLVSFDLK
jgi:hypothetical protein